MKLETFSYLPPMTDEQLGKQVAHIIKQGLIPAVEYTRTPGTEETYWTMWELPLINAKTADDVMKEVAACRAANPGAFIKIIGYDAKKQAQAVSFVAYRPDNVA